jgi:hypothetical protein
LWNQYNQSGALELSLNVSVATKTFPILAFRSLMLQLRHAVIDRGGVMQFAHTYLKQAVQKRYLTKAQFRHECQHHLINLFEAVPQVTDRKATELPWILWQLALDTGADSPDRSSILARLMHCICDLPMLEGCFPWIVSRL